MSEERPKGGTAVAGTWEQAVGVWDVTLEAELEACECNAVRLVDKLSLARVDERL